MAQTNIQISVPIVGTSEDVPVAYLEQILDQTSGQMLDTIFDNFNARVEELERKVAYYHPDSSVIDYYIGWTNGHRTEFANRTDAEIINGATGYASATNPVYTRNFGDNNIFYLLYKESKVPTHVIFTSLGVDMPQDVVEDNSCPHADVVINGITYKEFGIVEPFEPNPYDSVTIKFDTMDYYVGWITGENASFNNFKYLTVEQLQSYSTGYDKIYNPSITKTVTSAEEEGNRQIFFLMWKEDSAPKNGSLTSAGIYQPIDSSDFYNTDIFEAVHEPANVTLNGAIYHVQGIRGNFDAGDIFVVNFKNTVQIGCGADSSSAVFADTYQILTNNMVEVFNPNDGDYLFIKVDKSDTVKNLYTDSGVGLDYEIPIDGGTVYGDYKYYQSTIQISAGELRCKINKNVNMDYYIGWTDGTGTEFANKTDSEIINGATGYTFANNPVYTRTFGDNNIFYLLYQEDKAPELIQLNNRTIYIDESTVTRTDVVIEGVTYKVFDLGISRSAYNPLDAMTVTFSLDYYVGWFNDGNYSPSATFANLTTQQLQEYSTGYSKSDQPTYKKIVNQDEEIGEIQIFFLMWKSDSAPQSGSVTSGGITDTFSAADFVDTNVFRATHTDASINCARYHVQGLRGNFDAGDTLIVNFT